MITPGDFRAALNSGTPDHEFLIAEYRRLWDENERLTHHVTHIQGVSTILVVQKRAVETLAQDILCDLRLEGTVTASTILRNLSLIKTLLTN